MNNLTPLEKDIGREINLHFFWKVLEAIECEYQAHGLSKYNIFQAVRLRYYDNGAIAHTYKEIGEFYNCSSEYARSIVRHGMNWMCMRRIAKHF